MFNDRAQSLFLVRFADLIDPLRYQPLYRQKYVLNERGETSTFVDCKKQRTTKLVFVLCIGNIASHFNILFKKKTTTTLHIYVKGIIKFRFEKYIKKEQ